MKGTKMYLSCEVKFLELFYVKIKWDNVKMHPAKLYMKR